MRVFAILLFLAAACGPIDHHYEYSGEADQSGDQSEHNYGEDGLEPPMGGPVSPPE